MRENLTRHLEDIETTLKAADKQGDAPETKESRPKLTAEESVRQTLLRQLPTELQKKWKNSTPREIMEIIEARKEAGFETLKGYHTSNIDLNVGEFVAPGPDKTVHYTTSLDNLYGKKAKYLYIVEGSNNDLANDPGLGWRQSRAGMKILEKIKLTPDALEKLEASFAEVEYS